MEDCGTLTDVFSPTVPSQGDLVIALVTALEKAGHFTVYLRNYENLPGEVGNDVDLLVPPGSREHCRKLLIREARHLGWQHVKTVEFGPLAVYLADPQSTETLHIDLFDRLDWHALEFADCQKIMHRRVWNGQVHIPCDSDSVYLNIITRLIYQGKIRPKHQKQVVAFLSKHGTSALRKAFTSHLGSSGSILTDLLLSENWEPGEEARRSVRKAAFRQYGLCNPHRLLTGLFRYCSRIVKKILRPPGVFIILTGSDGIAKSSLMERITPWCAEWNGGRSPLNISLPPCDHSRGIRLAIMCCSAGWFRWFRRILPAMAASKAVIADGGSIATSHAPHPDLRIVLATGVKTPDTVVTSQNHISLNVSDDPDVVFFTAKQAILDALSSDE